MQPQDNPRFCLVAQPIHEAGHIGFPLDVPRVVAEGDTVAECSADMADHLESVLPQCAAWDFKLGVGKRARREATEYLVEGPLVGHALTSEEIGWLLPPGWGGARLVRPPEHVGPSTSKHVGATGPCYMTAGFWEEEDDREPEPSPEGPLLPEGLQLQGDTLRECLSAVADELAPVVETWHIWDFTLDIGQPPDYWGLPGGGA